MSLKSSSTVPNLIAISIIQISLFPGTQNRRFSSTVACCSCEQSELTTTGPDQSNPIKWEYNWDRKKEEYEKNQVLKKKGVIRQIVMVRHGQYDHSYGDDDLNPLTPLGREQASLTGKRIAELVRAGIIYPIRDVKYSTMLRATQTFEKILPSLDSDPNTLPTHRIQPCSMIREGAVCRPDPPSAGWHPTDDDFLKDEARVGPLSLHIVNGNCRLNDFQCIHGRLRRHFCNISTALMRTYSVLQRKTQTMITRKRK